MTKQYPSQAKVRDLFNYNSDGYLVWRAHRGRVAAGERAGTPLTTGYMQVRIDGSFYRANRLVWIWHYGDIPDGLVVDHINAVRDDDRIENLALLTHRENTTRGATTHKRSSLPLGVTRHSRNVFMARVRVNGAQHTFGKFDNPEDAAQAYKQAVADIAIAERQQLAHHLEMTEGAGALL